MWRLIERVRGFWLPEYLRGLELSSLAHDHFRRHPKLRDGWDTLPRGDWALELLVRAGLDTEVLALVVATLRELGEHSTRVDWDGLERRFAAHRAGDEPETLLAALLAAHAAVVEVQPGVAAARARMREVRVRSRAVSQLELDAYDREHAAAQVTMAKRIRDCVPYEVLARALGAEKARSPYR